MTDTGPTRSTGPTGLAAPSWPRRLALAAAVWVTACALAYLRGLEPAPGLLAVVVAVCFGLVWLYLDVSANSSSQQWHRDVEDPVSRPGEDPRLSLLTRVVSSHLDSRDATDDQLHRRLSAVAEERLVAHHGLTLEADPRRAADVLGPDLADYLSGPPDRQLTAARIDRLLTRIEQL